MPGTPAIHQAASNAVSILRAWPRAHARVEASPFESARSARSYSPRIV